MIDELEAAVLSALLANADPALRAQVAGLQVTSREHTGVGFFTDFAVDPQAPRSAVPAAHLGGVHAEIAGLQHGAGFVLFVEDGQLSMLEGYTYDEPWPTTIGAFTISPA